jgi:hypothetical protein
MRAEHVQQRARPQRAMELGHHADHVSDVLQDVHGEDVIERCGCEREPVVDVRDDVDAGLLDRVHADGPRDLLGRTAPDVRHHEVACAVHGDEIPRGEDAADRAHRAPHALAVGLRGHGAPDVGHVAADCNVEREVLGAAVARQSLAHLGGEVLIAGILGALPAGD